MPRQSASQPASRKRARAENPPVAPNPAPPNPANDMAMPKVLVIDDDHLVRRTISRILQSGGYEVALAEDGAKGVAKFRAERPDLVITDIIMPEQEGIETIIQLLRDNPSARIIAVSGGGRLGSMDFLTVANRLGAAATLRKPFEPAELLGCVARALAPA
ncbi:MAG TPA: response regulator [Stellaceae bacterium]|nr:response regulator [Stellaceae bacterium]